jgi:hypothetical protein
MRHAIQVIPTFGTWAGFKPAKAEYSSHPNGRDDLNGWFVPSDSSAPRDTQGVSRHQQRFIDRMPWSLQTSFYLINSVTGGEDRMLPMARHLLRRWASTWNGPRALSKSRAGTRSRLSPRLPTSSTSSGYPVMTQRSKFFYAALE